MSENDKDKETKKASEAESYGEYEGEGIENVEEGPEEGSTPQINLSLDSSKSFVKVSTSETDQTLTDSYEERKRLLLVEKWLSVTGKKPRNIPTLRKPFDEGSQKRIFFGDRKPGEVEKNIRRKLLLAAQKIENRGLKYGKVRQEVRLPALFSGLLCIRFHPTEECMACSNRRGGVEIRDCNTGEVQLHLKTLEETERLAVRSVRYFPNDAGKIYVVGQTGCVQVFSGETAELLGASEHFGTTYNMDISADGNFLATGGKAGRLYIIDPNTLQVISKRSWPNVDEPAQATLYEEFHRMRIYGMKFHETYTNLLATGGWDNTVKIWDVRTLPAIRSIQGPAIYGDGLDLKNNAILTATWRVENSLNLWDFNSGRLIKSIPIKSKSTKFEGEFLYTCRFFKDDPEFPHVNSSMVAVGGSGFSNVLVISIKTDHVVAYFPSFKPIMCLDIRKNLLAYGGTESVFRIAEMEEKHQRR